MTRTRKTILFAATTALLAFRSAEVSAAPFVTIRDDGTVAGKITSPPAFTKKFIPLYDASGAPRPEVISVWTAFPMDGGPIQTLFDPVDSTTKGIGLENDVPVSKSSVPPVRAILLHNDFTQLATRAESSGAASADGFASYLFLLELSHMWGPSVRLPATDGGAAPDALIGFTFHWSFWMDAGHSPAGGNAWKDNGDGTFTVTPATPKSVHFTPLDLYLMGLADPSEVPPFGLLENAVPPKALRDPSTGRAFGASSFPYFGSEALTVTATRRTIHVEELVAENGARSPARETGPLSVGIVLVVAKDASDADVERAKAAFEPVAASLAPAFEEATGGKRKLDVVTHTDALTADGGTESSADAGPSAAPPSSSSESGGCAAAPHDARGGGALAALVTLVALAFATKRRSR